MVLAQCIAVPGERGTAGDLRCLREAGIECFFLERNEPLGDLKAEAVAFFKRNQQLFAQRAILEFRFPTVLNGVAELEAFLRGNARQLESELARLKGMAQVTVYPHEKGAHPKPGSGTEYLRAKREQEQQRADRLRGLTQLGDGLVRESLVQQERILLLVARHDAAELLKRLKAHYSAAGPFPPSSFAKLLS